MNREIPKPLRDALASQAVGDVHPSPDVLTSFIERALTPVESEVVTHHLAQCVECREIVFLASGAAEDEVRDERELVAATAASRVAAMPAYAASSRPAPLPDTSRARWTGRMRWAVSIVAAASLVCAGLLLQFSRVSNKHNVAPMTVASDRPGPENPESQITVTTPSSQGAFSKSPAPKTPAKAVPQRATAARTGEVSSSTTVARNATDRSPSPPASEPAPQAKSSNATGSVVGGASEALVPEIRPQSSFAESETAQPLQLQQGAPVEFGKSQLGIRSVKAVTPRWRISPNGYLERSTATDQWTRVLADHPAIFRAVAAVGNDVWAGGNGGALFHSPDGGEHWSKVSLAANSNVETGAIVSIRFDDSQHGLVASDSGSRWVTTDGGVTWMTQ